MHDMPDDVILKVDSLKTFFPVRKGFFGKAAGCVKAVNDISFSIPRGKTLGLVGESGSGKTTAGRTVLRALDPTGGRMWFRGKQGIVDLAKLDKHELKAIRSEIQMVFQDPYSSLNPRMPVLELVGEPLRAHGWKTNACRERVRALLETVGLDPRFMKRFPHAFSGGQRQRIGIARALALRPALVVADEPVSALDVSVQAQILNLLRDLQQELNLAYLFIAHDLSVIRYICDRVAVMYAGTLVEEASVMDLFENPGHPYTRMLMDAAPPPDPHVKWMDRIDGFAERRQDEAAAARPAPENGCAFAPRCGFAEDVCWKKIPRLDGLAHKPAEHRIACHLFSGQT